MPVRTERNTPRLSEAAVTWIVTGLVTAFAALWRLVELGRPARLVFDETYYVKQAYSLLHLGYEGRWGEHPNPNFAAGIFTDLTDKADYVVHPAVGKWMIAAGMALTDPASPVGWRISAAITGTISVGLVVLIARKLFGHIVFGAIAGLLLAVDGIHLVMSRISILDIFLSFWALLAFGALLLDRDQHRRYLARGRGGMRWWLLAAGIAGGMATGVKWSGIYFVAVFGIVAVVWNIADRRAIGNSHWLTKGIFIDGVLAFVTLVPTALLTYAATWIPWALSDNSYMRHHSPSVLGSLWEYHVKMWGFHTSLTNDHTYMSSPFGWLAQIRPTSFAWQKIEGGAELCGSDTCASAILAVGNPIVWWGALLAFPIVAWGALRYKDSRAWAILAGYAAGYLPWFAYLERTIFTFYTVAFVPFVVLALTYALWVGVNGFTNAEPRRRGVFLAAGVLIAALIFGAFFWAVWTGKWVPYWYWHAHIFMPSWV